MYGLGRIDPGAAGGRSQDLSRFLPDIFMLLLSQILCSSSHHTLPFAQKIARNLFIYFSICFYHAIAGMMIIGQMCSERQV